MADPVTASLAAGFGLIQVGADIMGANAKAKEARRQAELDDQQANEILNRAHESKITMEHDNTTEIGNTVSGYAAAGVDLSGSALQVLEDKMYWMRRDVRQMENDAKFQSDQVRAGAQSLRDSAGTLKTVGLLQAGGDLASVGSNVYNAWTGKNSGKYTKTTGGS